MRDICSVDINGCWMGVYKASTWREALEKACKSELNHSFQEAMLIGIPSEELPEDYDIYEHTTFYGCGAVWVRDIEHDITHCARVDRLWSEDDVKNVCKEHDYPYEWAKEKLDADEG